MREFKLEKVKQGPVVILKVEGYIDAHTAPKVEEIFKTLLEEKSYQIIIDFAELDYISSAGLGVFMAFIESFRKNGGDIKMCRMQDNVYHIFELLGFPSIFSIYPRLRDATESYDKL